MSGNKVVKKELIVALRGEIYFVKFIINPEEDDVEPGVIFGRSFLQTEEEEEKSNDDWNHLLDFNIDDIPLLVVIYHEEAAKEELAFQNEPVSLLYLRKKEPIIGTNGLIMTNIMKILDEVWKDKVELHGKIVKEEEEAVKRIKGEALKEKSRIPGALFISNQIGGGPLGRDDMKRLIEEFIINNHTQDYGETHDVEGIPSRSKRLDKLITMVEVIDSTRIIAVDFMLSLEERRVYLCTWMEVYSVLSREPKPNLVMLSRIMTRDYYPQVTTTPPPVIKLAAEDDDLDDE
ncbi:hypothetical protein Tco_0909756 [Tanacetum coccineum]|uniref:Uncharacterized protein n=1 Tax=Tanacetum coccineum TaxID=301880 RepID=A0ABQ5CQW5_9ASTR